jgi:hypothetical protein
MSQDFDKEIIKTIKEWVESIPSANRELAIISVSGVSYSPKEILKNVEQKTTFGNSFLSGLVQLHSSMVSEDPNASVLDLIRKSI